MNNYTDVNKFTGEGFERFEHAEGGVEYRYNDRYHREEGPAITLADGTELWYLYGKFQKFTGPIDNLTQATKELEATQLSEYKITGVGYERISIPDLGVSAQYLDGKFHCEDAPAVLLADGTKIWYLNGEKHRTNGPAVIRPDGSEAYFNNGKRHRQKGPALIKADGSAEYWIEGVKQLPPATSKTEYREVKKKTGKGYERIAREDGSVSHYLDGELHCEDAPAVISKEGQPRWYLKGKRHRVDGPAIISNDGKEEWYYNGVKHRIGGPAVIKPNGTVEFWEEGQKVSA